MSTPKELEARIRRLRWPGLKSLWETPGWEPGEAFEYLVLRAFELEDGKSHPLRVRYPYSVDLFDENVEQIDGAVHLPELSILIESKDWDGNVPIEPIAKMRNQLLRRPAGTVGLLFAKRDFTSSAKALAHFTLPEAILLWIGRELDLAFSEEAMCRYLRLKYRMCVEDGVVHYNICEGPI